MSFAWLKHYMPRGLYQRAALILIVPVVALQILVSVGFVQRHYAGVSEQMTREVSRSLVLALQGNAELRAELGFDLSLHPRSALPPEDVRQWYDGAGVTVARVLRDRVPGVQRVMLPDDRTVAVWIRDGGPLQRVTFDRRRASASNPHQLLVAMVVFGVFMTGIAFIYLRNQLRPVTRLADVAQAFGRGRRLDYAPGGATEVRAAGAAFLDMRQRIERQLEQRTLMLSGVSHDMRTPLTRLKLGVSLLDEADRAPLERDIEDMQHLIDAFLEFARGEANAGDAELTDPIALVTDIVENCRRGGTEVALDLLEGQGEVALRPVSLRRAVENLIGNAVRYGTHSRVSVLLTEKALRIRVEDDGPGIPAKDRERALRPFVRLDPARNQNQGSGVGLGLAIAADIARSHGGVLRLSDSEALGGLCADIVIGR